MSDDAILASMLGKMRDFIYSMLFNVIEKVNPLKDYHLVTENRCDYLCRILKHMHSTGIRSN